MTTAHVRLELDSRPESVTLVRSMVAGAAGHLGLHGERLDDLRTAVSEACNNVVLHAYDGEPGPLSIEFVAEPGEIRVAVVDRGHGIRSIISPQNRMRVGLALISALADRAEVDSPRHGGTEVRMAFTTPAEGVVPGAPPDVAVEAESAELDGDVVAFISPVSLLGAVLGRICTMIAVRAHFSVDRHADLDLVADELTSLARRAARSAGIGFSVSALDRRLELCVGPFAAGSCVALQRPPRTRADAAPLQLLADELSVWPDGAGETLRVALAARRPQV